MAENTVSTLVPFGNQNDPIHISFLDGKVPAVSSIDVARHFSKKHCHVLRDINNLMQVLPPVFIESNFGLNEHKDKIGRTLSAYLLTREAFSLLVMGFTGKAAIRWKLAYIEAFNALEEQASISREEHQRLLSLARESGYRQGREETLALPATQELMERIRLEGVEQGRKLQKRQDGYAMTMKAIGTCKGALLSPKPPSCAIFPSTPWRCGCVGCVPAWPPCAARSLYRGSSWRRRHDGLSERKSGRHLDAASCPALLFVAGGAGHRRVQRAQRCFRYSGMGRVVLLHTGFVGYEFGIKRKNSLI